MTPLSAPWIELAEVDSTNAELRRRAERDPLGPGTVVVAASQTAGRGRLGRSWYSPPGLGLYLSVLLRPEGAPDLAPRLTLVGALAVCTTCRDLHGVDAGIKWPNDVLAAGRKIAGILAEARAVGARAGDLVLGVGVNANHTPKDFPEALRERATSLRAASGHIVDIAELGKEIVTRVVRWAAEVDEGKWLDVAARYADLTRGIDGSAVRVSAPGVAARCGVSRGIDERGGLVVRFDDGAESAIRVGDAVEFLA